MEKFEFIAKQHADGATIVQTIKACMREYKISLSEAHEIVSMHPVWASVVKAAEPLYHDLAADKE